MPRTASGLTPNDRVFLLRLQVAALRYFLDNQGADGYVLDRQANHGPFRLGGWRSTAATGMGLIAVALASAGPFRLVARSEAVARVRRALATALDRTPHTHGVLPHYTDSRGHPVGADRRSTIDGGWLVAGALWAAEFLGDVGLRVQADALYNRVDWGYWTNPGDGLIRHGEDARGRFLSCTW